MGIVLDDGEITGDFVDSIAEGHCDFVGAREGLLPRQDAVPDHERGRIVVPGWTGGVVGQLEVEDRLARHLRQPDAEQSSATRVPDPAEGQLRGVIGGIEQPERDRGADRINWP